MGTQLQVAGRRANLFIDSPSFTEPASPAAKPDVKDRAGRSPSRKSVSGQGFRIGLASSLLRVGVLAVGHAAIFVFAFLSAFALRFDLAIPPEWAEVAVLNLTWVLGFKVGIFYLTGQFYGWWRYVTMADLAALLKAATMSLIAMVLIDHFLINSHIPRSMVLEARLPIPPCRRFRKDAKHAPRDLPSFRYPVLPCGPVCPRPGALPGARAGSTPGSAGKAGNPGRRFPKPPGFPGGPVRFPSLRHDGIYVDLRTILPDLHILDGHADCTSFADGTECGLQALWIQDHVDQFPVAAAIFLVGQAGASFIHQLKFLRTMRQFQGEADEIGAGKGRWVENQDCGSCIFDGDLRIDRAGDGFQALPGKLFAHLVNLVEADFHLFVHLVDRTTANRVMRVVLHEQAPGLIDD